MNAKSLFALSLAAALGVAVPAAYAEPYHGGHDYRGDHRDSRDHARHERERYERERHFRHDYRVYHHEPRYVVAAPVFMPPPVQYQAPSGINIVLPIQF